MQNRKDLWRLNFHLMPPSGWLNDPNGLCEFHGVYHIFFQYAPVEPGPDGRPARTWGHYRGKDLLHLEFAGVPFWPVDPEDHDGCYSGSALVEDDRIRLYYTGNVKEPGDHDYTYSGRQANEILVETDGETFGEKKVLLTNADYPAGCTCHVRDPKVWKEDGTYYMVLGARVTDAVHRTETDRGEVLVYESQDGIDWKYFKTLRAEERFGYMWECPDYFSLGERTFLGICPQGLAHEKYRFQNVHQSGYCRVLGPLDGGQKLEDFREWDMGFDFYAPQTFVDESGRRILIGWAGLPDKPYGNPTADVPDLPWENCLTVPRELTLSEDGQICQNPVSEIEDLRYDETMLLPSRPVMVLPDGAGDFEVCFLEGTEKDAWNIRFAKDTVLSFLDGILTLELSEAEGYGRTVRRAETGPIEYLRILVDSSILEIYVNDGAYVMTTRFYPSYSGSSQDLEVQFDCGTAAVTGWKLHPCV